MRGVLGDEVESTDLKVLESNPCVSELGKVVQNPRIARKGWL
jgi:hypothetical protein